MGIKQQALQKALTKINDFVPANEAEERDKAEIANELFMMIGFIGGNSEDNLPENFIFACDTLLESIESLNIQESA